MLNIHPLMSPDLSFLRRSSRRTGSECVPELVELQAAERPGSPAILSECRTLTYHQLNGQACRLGRFLRNIGIEAESIVGICLPPSADSVTAALATWKVGAAFLPLDPSWPDERLIAILRDAQVRAVLIEPGTGPRLRGPWHTVDITSPSLASGSALSGSHETSADQLAYVIYTSGSTGRPKGIEITHGGLRNLVEWHNRAFAVTAADHASQVAKPAFDASIWEVWPYLAVGASVHIAPEDVRISPDRLREWLVCENITVAFAPTAIAEELITTDWPVSTSLRYLLTGGDTLRHWPLPGLPFAVVNNYGPSECAVVVTSGVVGQPSAEEKLPSIGCPILNTKVLLLDENLRPVADGDTGEICVIGPGVARGYVGDRELTAAKFVTDLTGSGSALYRTGDQGRMLQDGRIAFCGRSDSQVKILGNRIELGEICAAINALPEISTNYVTTHQNCSGSKQLVAYVVFRGSQLSRSELQQHLRTQLPDYMVPSMFVRIDSMPVTPNGKVDPKALPEPNSTNLVGEAAARRQLSAVEARLARLVSEILSVEEVSPDENFFLVGGHSLLGAELVARIARDFGVRVSLRTLFANPTVAELAKEVEKSSAGNQS